MDIEDFKDLVREDLLKLVLEDQETNESQLKPLKSKQNPPVRNLLCDDFNIDPEEKASSKGFYNEEDRYEKVKEQIDE